MLEIGAALYGVAALDVCTYGTAAGKTQHACMVGRTVSGLGLIGVVGRRRVLVAGIIRTVGEYPLGVLQRDERIVVLVGLLDRCKLYGRGQTGALDRIEYAVGRHYAVYRLPRRDDAVQEPYLDLRACLQGCVRGREVQAETLLARILDHESIGIDIAAVDIADDDSLDRVVLRNDTILTQRREQLLDGYHHRVVGIERRLHHAQLCDDIAVLAGTVEGDITLALAVLRVEFVDIEDIRIAVGLRQTEPLLGPLCLRLVIVGDVGSDRHGILGLGSRGRSARSGLAVDIEVDMLLVGLLADGQHGLGQGAVGIVEIDVGRTLFEVVVILAEELDAAVELTLVGIDLDPRIGLGVLDLDAPVAVRTDVVRYQLRHAVRDYRLGREARLGILLHEGLHRGVELGIFQIEERSALVSARLVLLARCVQQRAADDRRAGRRRENSSKHIICLHIHCRLEVSYS